MACDMVIPYASVSTSMQIQHKALCDAETLPHFITTGTRNFKIEVMCQKVFLQYENCTNIGFDQGTRMFQIN